MSEVPVGKVGGVAPERGLAELAEEICSAAAGIAAATGRWLELVAEFDRREGWAGEGLKSCAHWLAWKCGLSPVAAREHVRVARALAGLPLMAAATRTGRLSYSCVRALTRIADTDNEQDLLAVGLAGTVAHVERIVRGWRRADRSSDPDAESARFGLRVHWDDDGSLRVSGRLNAEDGALLLAALSAAEQRVERERPAAEHAPADGADGIPSTTRHDVEGVDNVGSEVPRGACGQDEALVEMARTFLDPDPERQSAAGRHQVVVHVDADVLAADTAAGAAHLECGPALSSEQAARIACDAALVVMLRSGREVLDVGRASRTIPASITRALWARDGGCRFPGCHEHRRSRVQGHHIRHWSRGGRTALANLVLLCGYHHRLIHQQQFGVQVDAVGDFVFRNPRGHRIEPGGAGLGPAWADPKGPPLAMEELLPLWAGERLDLDYAVSVLLAARDLRSRAAQKVATPEAA